MRSHFWFYLEILVLICLSVVSALTLAIIYFRKFHGISNNGFVYGPRAGNVFQGPTEWADIDEGADHSSISVRAEEGR